MTNDTQAVEAELFGHDERTDEKAEALLTQYKLFVDTSEALVLRRQGVNNFFLSVNSLLLAAAGLLLRDSDSSKLEALVLIALAIGGVTLCVVWRRLITSFQQLSSGKFKVIHQLEDRLPARMFAAEWIALGSGEDPKKYRPFTKVESKTPLVFGVLQSLLVLVGLWMLLG